MTIAIPVIPDEVLASIATAVEAVRDEVRQAVRLTEGRRLATIGREYVRRNGEGYQTGTANILAATGVDGVTLPDTSDEDEDRRCDEASSCCGYCESCDSHHNRDYVDRIIMVYGARCTHVYCLDCEHVCDD